MSLPRLTHDGIDWRQVTADRIISDLYASVIVGIGARDPAYLRQCDEDVRTLLAGGFPVDAETWELVIAAAERR